MIHTFSDSQLATLKWNPEYLRRGQECPVCLWPDPESDKTYVYKGETFECPDDDYGHVAMRLAKFYWLHFIPLQYQRLIWDEFPHDEARQNIDFYVSNFKRLRLTGAGWTIYGKEMGTGKTWAACHILRELTKAGYDTHFASFMGVKGYFELEDPAERSFFKRRVREAEVLVLDEVKAPFSQAQRDFFEDKLEELLRERTYMNFPTIVTTNMTMKEFDAEYPRCYSLLAGSNSEIHLSGEDARKSGILFESNQALAAKGEGRPIT